MVAFSRSFVSVAVEGSARVVLAATFVLFGLSWMLSYSAGGASSIPPHLFYIPLLVLGIRFGIPAVLAGSVGAALLAGPALPAVVADGVPQETSYWVTRGVFFAVVSSLSAALAHSAVREQRVEFKALRRKAELSRALRDNQLELRYQPIVRLDTGAVVGAEALVRWNHPDRGIVGPDQFLPLAEQTGLIHPLGAWVLERTVADMREWKEALGGQAIPIHHVAINASRSQFDGDGSLVRRVNELAETGPLPVQLVIEVTETGFVDDQASLVNQLVQLQLSGVPVAMDDFGTGQSTLSAVRDLPFDIIKIDRMFVTGLSHDPSVRQIVENTIDLARRLGKDLVAEGVETPDQRDALLELGILNAQGYLFARPLTLADLKTFVAEHVDDEFRSGGAGHRILVVDDREGDHLFVAQLLVDWGEISFARSGPQAIDMVSKGDFTLVLLDIQMPHMNGLETARALRSIQDERGLSGLVIVGLSARDLPEDEQAARSAGMDAYLTKPLSTEALNRALLALREAPRDR